MTIDELRAQLRTPEGFAARVRPPHGLRTTGIVLTGGVLALGGIPLVVGRQWEAWPGLLLLVAGGLLVVLAGLARERLLARALHEAYLDRGWVTVQAPTGLVRDDSGESSTVRRDATLTPEPRADEMDAALPIVLVGARDTPVEVVAADARSLRERVRTMEHDRLQDLCHRAVARVIYRDVPASDQLPVPDGTLLTVRHGTADFVVVVPPRPGGRRRRPRYHAVGSSDSAG